MVYLLAGLIVPTVVSSRWEGSTAKSVVENRIRPALHRLYIRKGLMLLQSLPLLLSTLGVILVKAHSIIGRVG
jgi:hypothetical protein